MVRILLLIALSSSVSAESVWMDDGSLVIIDAQESIVYVDEDNNINYDVIINSDEPAFIYNDSLTVCMPTNDGSICY